VYPGIDKGEPVTRTLRARLFMLNQATGTNLRCDKVLSDFRVAVHRASNAFESFKIHEDWDTNRTPIPLDAASAAKIRAFADEVMHAAEPLRAERPERKPQLAAADAVITTARGVATAFVAKDQAAAQAQAIKFARAVDDFVILVPAGCK
jgi:hypothetical protein